MVSGIAMPSWSTSNTPAKPNRLATGAGLMSWSISGADRERPDDVVLIALPAEDAETDKVLVALIRVAEFSVTPREVAVRHVAGLERAPGSGVAVLLCLRRRQRLDVHPVE